MGILSDELILTTNAVEAVAAAATTAPEVPKPKTKSCIYRFEHEILVIEDVIDFGPELTALAERLNIWDRATMTQPGREASPYTGESRNNDAVTVAGATHPDFKPFEIMLCQAFNSCAYAYRALNKYFHASGDTYHQLLRYKVGQHFHLHTDTIAGHKGWGARILSAVAFLNDDFEGGGLVFPRQKIEVKAKRGTLILFPSTFTHPHAALDVTKGVKYSAVTWWV
jgi:predicted 2-oxoglutarate/Fe(II)-dependent dioxygenase YbiX